MAANGTLKNEGRALKKETQACNVFQLYLSDTKNCSLRRPQLSDRVFWLQFLSRRRSWLACISLQRRQRHELQWPPTTSLMVDPAIKPVADIVEQCEGFVQAIGKEP